MDAAKIEKIIREVPCVVCGNHHVFDEHGRSSEKHVLVHDPAALAQAVVGAWEKAVHVWDNSAYSLRMENDALKADVARLRDLYADMVNQFALYFTKDGIEMVGTGGLSDLEAAFQFFGLPDPCKFGEFRATLSPPPLAPSVE